MGGRGRGGGGRESSRDKRTLGVLINGIRSSRTCYYYVLQYNSCRRPQYSIIVVDRETRGDCDDHIHSTRKTNMFTVGYTKTAAGKIKK